MAGLHIVRTDSRDDPALVAARAQFARHGFAAPSVLRWPGWTALHFGYAVGGVETLHVDGDDFVAVAGTLTFGNAIGKPALVALLAGWAGVPDWDRLGGQFTVLIRKTGRTTIFGDWFGAHQLFHDDDLGVLTTSFLAAVRALPRPRFDAQGVYEFAFNVVPIGNDTVIEGLKLLDPRTMLTLDRDGAHVVAIEKRLPDTADAMPPAERIALHRRLLMRVVDAHVGHFGDRIFCPLSGGIDSRLLLAALRAAGSRPHVYVYGDRDEDDVVFAEAIGQAMGFAVEWVDKDGAVSVTPDGFAERVATDFEQFDALPTFGNIFDNGGAAYGRDKRHAGGALAASGGCGEIWRDFFFLPDRPLSPRAVAHSFFARFDARDATGAFDPRAFLGAIEAKIADALGVANPAAKLSRQWIEQAYPRVRCRSLFGREISLESRLSPYMMPFLDHRLVAAAMRLPMPMKQAGRFEAQLLAAIDPELAAQPSAYGHSFTEPPSAAHVRSEALSRIRPAWLRRRSYAIQRRLGRATGDEHGGLLTPEWLGRVLDLDMPAMRRFFVIERIADRAVYRRIAALEYLAEQTGLA
ncbi:adenine nucleotide alpha hydrolase family protein [Sphingomonas baiyangensis]|uniref:Asparagine synthase (Glutamine-hydrolysing) n=1 Tax=Sphingomonas baiyangensis TaxID=2572576 RepID=A0A4U1L4Z7_9SPHN|nr:hypothetical protein [Sphingomonas baiyangensis]TKD51353.1 hypothetical protein FBR43_11770 [Sphingomonas baiyangensis]